MLHKRTCTICEALCGIIVEHDGARVTAIRGNPDDVFSRGHICPKAVALQDLHEDPDRLRTPVRRVGDTWQPISWEEAVEEVATRLHQTQTRYGRHAVGVYAGNPNAHSHSSLLAGIAFHTTLRSRTKFSATSVDQLPHMYAALQMFGHQLMMPVPDLDRTHRLVVLGANPLVSNGSIMTTGGVGRRLADMQARGGKLVVIDPRRTETADKADEFHYLRPGTDALLELAVIHTLFEEGLVADGVWRTWTDGVDEVRRIAEPFAPERVAEATGMAADTIRQLARGQASAPSAVWYARFGACVQEFGGLAAWAGVVINVLTGNLDRPGGMMFATPAVDLLGVAARAGHKGHAAIWKSRVAGLPEFGGELPVAALADEMLTPGDGQMKAMLVIAGNPVLSTPDGARVAQGLAGLEFVAALDMYVTATSRHAHIIIPPPSQLERDDFPLVFSALAVRNHARYCGPTFAPPANLHDDGDTLLAIAARIEKLRGRHARALGLATFRKTGFDPVVDVGLRAGPYGWRSSHKLSLRKLKAAPDGIDLGPLESRLPGALHTAGRRVQLAPAPLVADVERLRASIDRPVPPLVLIGRRQLRSNNSWMHNAPRLVRGKSRCTLLVHPADAAAAGIASGERARLRSRVGTLEAVTEVTDTIMPGVVSLPHGWGHDRHGAKLGVASAIDQASLNDVTDASLVDALTGTSALSGVPVTLERAVS